MKSRALHPEDDLHTTDDLARRLWLGNCSKSFTPPHNQGVCDAPVDAKVKMLFEERDIEPFYKPCLTGH